MLLLLFFFMSGFRRRFITIWSGRKPKIKPAIMKLTEDNGGLVLPDINAKINSLKIAWVKRFMEPTNAKWKLLVKHKLVLQENFSIFHANIGPNGVKRFQNQNTFWTEVLYAWSKAVYQQPLSTKDVMGQKLWFNENIQVNTLLENNVWSELFMQGMKKIKDIVVPQGNGYRFMNLSECGQTFSRCDFLTWFALITAIPREWKQKREREWKREWKQFQMSLSGLTVCWLKNAPYYQSHVNRNGP